MSDDGRPGDGSNSGYTDGLQRWSIQVTDSRRDMLVEEYLAILHEHAIRLPRNPETGEPAVGEFQVLNFGGHDADYGLFEVWIAQEDNAGYGGKILVQRKGDVCPYHYHERKTETFYVLAGTVELMLGGETLSSETVNRITLEAGHTLTIRPGQGHLFTAIDGPAIIQEFATQCFENDNIFDDERIGVI